MRLFYKGTELGLRLKSDEKSDHQIYEVINQGLLEHLANDISSENEIQTLKDEKKSYLEILSCFQGTQSTSKTFDKIESFCFFTTHHMKEEAAITVKSLRLFHQEPIYITCDQESYDFLSTLKINDLFFEIITSDKSNRNRKRTS